MNKYDWCYTRYISRYHYQITSPEYLAVLVCLVEGARETVYFQLAAGEKFWEFLVLNLCRMQMYSCVCIYVLCMYVVICMVTKGLHFAPVIPETHF